jgi:hypothetical protein
MNLNENEGHLVDGLRQIQIQWELTVVELSKISHIPESVLSKYFSLNQEELANLPAVPSELLGGVALVGLFRKLITTYPTPEQQNEWLKRPNSVFEGHRPIDIIAMSPDHLAFVAYSVESGLRLVGKE